MIEKASEGAAGRNVMSKTVSTFSDGSTDAYKGKRPVTAGWAIFSRETGERLMSGHSLDRRCAEKTARDNLSYFGCEVLGDDHPLAYIEHVGRYMTTFKQRRNARAHNERRLAEITRRTRIEIVTVGAAS